MQKFNLCDDLKYDKNLTNWLNTLTIEEYHLLFHYYSSLLLNSFVQMRFIFFSSPVRSTEELMSSPVRHCRRPMLMFVFRSNVDKLLGPG